MKLTCRLIISELQGTVYPASLSKYGQKTHKILLERINVVPSIYMSIEFNPFDR